MTGGEFQELKIAVASKTLGAKLDRLLAGGFHPMAPVQCGDYARRAGMSLAGAMDSLG